MGKSNITVEKEETTVQKSIDSKIGILTFVVVAITAIIFGSVIGVRVHNVNVAKAADEALLQATPLQNYNLWYGMDKYPKYKVEAANMVNELMADGMSQEDACIEALNYMSDSVYEDTKNFIETENPEPDNYEELLEAHIKETQTIKY